MIICLPLSRMTKGLLANSITTLVPRGISVRKLFRCDGLKLSIVPLIIHSCYV